MILSGKAITAMLVALLWVGYASVPPVDAREDIESSVHARGAALTQWLLSGEVDRVHDLMSPQLRKTVGGVAGLRNLVRRLEQQAGKETAVLT